MSIFYCFNKIVLKFAFFASSIQRFQIIHSKFQNRLYFFCSTTQTYVYLKEESRVLYSLIILKQYLFLPSKIAIAKIMLKLYEKKKRKNKIYRFKRYMYMCILFTWFFILSHKTFLHFGFDILKYVYIS